MSHPVTVDEYDWYFAALEAQAARQPLPDVRPRTPECGFFRLQRDGRWLAVAIFPDDGDGAIRAIECHPNGKVGTLTDLDDIADLFGWCAGNVVPEGIWRSVVEAGAPWPDELPELRTPTNLSADPRDELLYQLKGEAEELTLFLKTPIDSQEKADRAANWKTRLDEIGKKAYEAKRKAKAPYEKRAKEEEARWQPLVVKSNELKGIIDEALTRYFAEVRRRQAEERAKAAEAGAALGKEQPVKAGTVGRTVAPVTVRRAVINDANTFALHLVETKNIDLRECLQTIADRMARAGTKPPGCEIVEDQKAR